MNFEIADILTFKKKSYLLFIQYFTVKKEGF